MQQTARRRLVLQQGLLFGAILGVVDLARTLVEGPTGLTAAVPGALGVVTFLVVAAGFVYLGFRVAARAGKASQGALAGLIAGLVVWVCYVAGALLVTFSNQETLRRQFQTAADQAHLGIQYTTGTVLAAIIVTLAFAVFLGAGVGAGLGALGGLLGKRRSVRAV
jgi:uncharacterized membrane protein